MHIFLGLVKVKFVVLPRLNQSGCFSVALARLFFNKNITGVKKKEKKIKLKRLTSFLQRR